MKVYIIVLHYGEVETTILCIKSISELTHSNFELELLVVSNSLKIKDQRSKIKNTYQKSKIIINERNLGFAGGMNRGIKEALKDKDCKYVLILNNDTILQRDLVIKLLETKKDIVAPLIKFKWDGNWKYDFGGKIDWKIGRTYHLENSKLVKDIDYVSGCCMLVKREVFEKIGLLDESYFFYFEDVDFCVRARKAGFIIGVCADTYIEHKLGGSIGRWSNKAIYYNLTSNAIFITKHMGWRRPIGYIYLLLLTVKIIFDKLKI